MNTKHYREHQGTCNILIILSDDLKTDLFTHGVTA